MPESVMNAEFDMLNDYQEKKTNTRWFDAGYWRTAGLSLAMVLFALTPLLAQNSPSSLREMPVHDSSLTITQSIHIALANNTDIKRSLLNIKSADQDVRKAWAEVMPEVNSNVSYTRNMEVPVNFIPEVVFDPQGDPDKLVPVAFGTDNNWQGGFTAEQTLFNGRAFVGISTSTLFKTAQKERYRHTAHPVLTQTRTAHSRVLIARENVRLQQSRIERLEANLEDNKARQEAGMLDDYQVLQVEVQLSNERPKLTEARYDLQEAYRQLKLVMGVPLDMEYRVTGDLQNYELTGESADHPANRALKQVNRMTPMVLDSTDWLMEKADDFRGDLKALEVQQDLKSQEIKAIKSRYLPILTASYDYNWRAAEPGTPNVFGNSEQRSRSQTLMLNVSLPLFQGFSRDADLTQAQIERKDLALQREQAQRQARNEIQSATESIEKALQTVTARRLALKRARRGYNMARARLKEGVSSQLDVTNAELELRQAELNYARMVHEFLAAKAEYDQAMGMVPYVDKKLDVFNER
jgi:outer membrane protein TolC